MRQFLLLAHRVPVDGGFTLNDLAGGGGRMDEVARVVSTGFTLSNDLRRDTELTIVFSSAPPPAARRIRLEGERLRYLNPDERSTAALLKNALVRSLGTDHEIESSPGLFVGPVDPPAELARFAAVQGTLWLTEGGEPLDPSTLPGGPMRAVLSDPTDPTPQEEEILRASGTRRVSLGPRSLRSSQCIDVLQNLFDRRTERTSAVREAPPARSP
jgi:tRNA (pseudouridine54-N1)-methyltransferase